MKKQFFIGNQKVVNTNEYPEDNIIVFPYNKVTSILDMRNCNMTVFRAGTQLVLKISPYRREKSPSYSSFVLQMDDGSIDKWQLNKSWYVTKNIKGFEKMITFLEESHNVDKYTPDLP